MPERPFKPKPEGAPLVAGEGAVFGGTEPVLLALSFLGEDGAVFGLVAEVLAFVAGGVSESMSISSGSPDTSSAVAWYFGRDFSGCSWVLGTDGFRGGFDLFVCSEFLRSGTSVGNAQLGSLNVSLQTSGLNLAV